MLPFKNAAMSGVCHCRAAHAAEGREQDLECAPVWQLTSATS